MPNAIKTRIVRIGKSCGVRIPKVWLELLGIGAEVELSVHGDRLVIRSLRRPRQDWEEKLRASIEQAGEDPPLEEFPPTAWDLNEWEW